MRFIIDEGDRSSRVHPRTLSPDLEYTVQTVVVAVSDPVSGAESTIYLGPRGFIEEFGPGFRSTA